MKEQGIGETNARKIPILAGILNVLIPGLGFVYLKKWKLAITYFLGIPIFLLIGILAALIMTTVPSTNGWLDFISLGLVWGTALIYMVWDSFTTPYCLAKAQDIPKQERTAILLNLVIPGLGFIYLKNWAYAFSHLFWAPFVVLIGTAIFFGDTYILGFSIQNFLRQNEIVFTIYTIIGLVLPRLFVWRNMILLTREIAKKQQDVPISQPIEA